MRAKSAPSETARDGSDVPSSRIKFLRKKLVRASLTGSEQELTVARELLYEDLPNVLDALDESRRREPAASWPVLGASVGILFLLLACLVSYLIWESTTEAAQERCQAMGGTYAPGGFRTDRDFEFCIFTSGGNPESDSPPGK